MVNSSVSVTGSDDAEHDYSTSYYPAATRLCSSEDRNEQACSVSPGVQAEKIAVVEGLKVASRTLYYCGCRARSRFTTVRLGRFCCLGDV